MKFNRHREGCRAGGVLAFRIYTALIQQLHPLPVDIIQPSENGRRSTRGRDQGNAFFRRRQAWENLATPSPFWVRLEIALIAPISSQTTHG
jgi:hypothetical protein